MTCDSMAATVSWGQETCGGGERMTSHLCLHGKRTSAALKHTQGPESTFQKQHCNFPAFVYG